MTTPIDARRRADLRTITLVGLAHGTSHSFHLLLPPLFPAFIHDFGLSYAQLGWLVTVFFVISGVGQALSGFLVDRVGARPVLYAAMGCFAAAALAAMSATGYGGLILAAALAGCGNAPFHPIDFTILNHRVSPQRLGHAFSVHGISGNLGWATAPVLLIGVADLTGSWRWGYGVMALLALGMLTLLVTQRAALDEHTGAEHPRRNPTAISSPVEHPLAFLRLPTVWLCFSFFFWTTAALAGIQSFSSPALGALYGLPTSVTAYVVTGYMLCGAAGMIAGGFLVARVERLERLIALAMALSAALLLIVASGVPAALAAAVLVALAGLGTGMAGPSRDMLIRRAAPPGATGRVYGTVYSGLDLGFAVAAPILGALMDRGQAGGLFIAAAASLGLGIVSAGLVGARVASRARSA